MYCNVDQCEYKGMDTLVSTVQSKLQHAHYTTECIISPPCTVTSVAGEKADIPPCALTVAKEMLTSLQAK